MYLISFLLTAAAPAQAAQDGADKVQQVIQHLIDGGVDIGGRILGALVIFIIGRFLISFLNKLVRRILERRKVDAGIRSFVESLVNILLMVLLIVAIVDKLGIETTSFAALLASAGVAVGMALSGNLQNFAGGLIILLFRPYKVGDWIECQGESGSVREIQIFHTILTTADNKTVYIPNGSASSGVVVNYSNEETRRVDWVVGVEYGEDYARVEEAARRIVAADKRILDTPAARRDPYEREALLAFPYVNGDLFAEADAVSPARNRKRKRDPLPVCTAESLGGKPFSAVFGLRFQKYCEFIHKKTETPSLNSASSFILYHILRAM